MYLHVWRKKEEKKVRKKYVEIERERERGRERVN
jgi:hypothetical protein